VTPVSETLANEVLKILISTVPEILPFDVTNVATYDGLLAYFDEAFTFSPSYVTIM